jgi:hypothetical protein
VKKLLIIILMLQGCAWSKTDRALFASYALTHTVDMVQTREILNNDNYTELNPIMEDMTPNQSTAFMLAGLGLVYLLADNIPKYRTWIIAVPLALSIVCVANNFSVGVTF